ncbi:YihY/virulence factor BrkB family protein [Subtercola frigoramans]|uniref:Membrane protein n=1 Tax=Subtercola frigoramans TaxID=120298 RepID=A0ABS2L4I3_9MICO|nr:YihY/virulence factor BrkB family protein [Subtercola frigoramans]MBM7472013.1 membrane protein [Subtercola frigoramans]
MTESERGATAEHRHLDRTAVRYALRRAYHGFFIHRGLDSGAALTFFSTLALFPATLALVSIVGLLDPQGDAVRVILTVLDSYIPKGSVESTRLALTQFTRIPNPVVALVIGLSLTLWAGASYATAFGRAVNAIYDVHEGRRFVKLRLLMLVESLALIVLLGALGVIVVVTPDAALTLVSTLGWPLVAVDLWSIAKWPLLVLLAVFTVMVLYYDTPNLKRPRVRWLTVGASFAIVGLAAMTIGYSIYITGFSGYDRFYGLLGGAIITLIWLFLSNLVLVVGAEVDAELTRARQLLRGIEAEESIQLPLRDNRRNLILARRLDRDLRDGRAIRERATLLRRHAPGDR